MAELKIGRITLGMCQTNCYYLYRENETRVIFVDPADDGEYLYQKLQEKHFTVEAILLTHGHFDHIMGSKKLRELTGAKIFALDAERELLKNPMLNVSAQWAESYSLEADEYIRDGQLLTFDTKTCKVIATPGHTIGGCCYYFEADKLLLSGDTLFYESVGRTDLPTGSMSSLQRSVQDKLMVLPEDVRVYPGHGMPTTIGHEKENNPFA